MFFGATTYDGKAAFRQAPVNYRNRPEDIDLIARVVRELAGGGRHSTSMVTLPTALASTAACASAVRSSGNRINGSPASAPTRSAPAATASWTSRTACSFALAGIV